MKLNLTENRGHIIIDDTTGKILSVVVKNVVENKFDFINVASYITENNKHSEIKNGT